MSCIKKQAIVLHKKSKPFVSLKRKGTNVSLKRKEPCDMKLSNVIKLQEQFKGLFDATKKVIEKHGFFSVFKQDLNDTVKAISVLNFLKPKKEQLYDLDITPSNRFDSVSIYDEAVYGEQSVKLLKITNTLHELAELPRLTESDARKAEQQIHKCLDSFKDKFKSLIRLENQCQEGIRTLATILTDKTFKQDYMMIKNADYTIILSPVVQFEKVYNRDLKSPAVVMIDNTMKVTQYPTFEHFELMTNANLTTVDKLQDIWEISERQNEITGKSVEDRIWDEVFALKERNADSLQKLTSEVKDISKDIQAYRQEIKEARRETSRAESHRGERYFIKDERFIMENFPDFYEKYQDQIAKMVLLSEKEYNVNCMTQYCPDSKDWVFTLSFTDENGKTLTVEADENMNVEKVMRKSFPIEISDKPDELVYDCITDEVNYAFAMDKNNMEMLHNIPIVKDVMFPEEKELTTKEKAESIKRELESVELE